MTKRLDKKQKFTFYRICVSLVLFFALMIIEHTNYFNLDNKIMFVLYLVPYLVGGGDVVKDSIRGIINLQMLDEKFLMTIATVGAFATGQYSEGVAVILFYQVGEFFQDYAVGKSRNSIQALLNIAPEYANVVSEDGSIAVVDPEDVKIGDILLVKPGEKFPIDGTVIEGSGLINTSALTGESMPRDVNKGDEVFSGCINGDSPIIIVADKVYDDSTVAVILEMVENASSRKSKTEAFITRFAKYYTPIVVGGALLLAVIPPFFTGEISTWILRACTFLVISCPCALVISIPLSFFCGIGAASREGILIKGSNYLEILGQMSTLVSDKTGTLTEGTFKISSINSSSKYSKKELLKIAASIEALSTHPIAVSICSSFEGEKYEALDVVNVPGKGITAIINGKKALAGNVALLEENSIETHGVETNGTCVYVAYDNDFVGSIEVSDHIKNEAAESIEELYDAGLKNIVMLTGDNEQSAARVASELGIKDFRFSLLPQDKVTVFEEILEDTHIRNPKEKVAFVGDGINDAPVLSRADVGIAMGSLGSDAAIEAADVVIMDDQLSKIPIALKIAHKIMRISKMNIVFVIGIKVLFLILGALGIAGMWAAVFADVGVAVICILNSMRCLKKQKA